MSTQELVNAPRKRNPVAAVARVSNSSMSPWLPALATGGLLWLCYFPLDLGWLGWVALAPLLMLVRSRSRPRDLYLSAWSSGLVFYWPALQWMRVADFSMYFTWAALATYCALYFPLAIYLMRVLDRRTRIPFLLAAPTVWTALEFLRSHLMTGFPWYLMAHSQQNYLPVIQMADVTGALGVSFVVVAVNAFVCEVLLGGWRRGVRVGLAARAAVLASVLALVIGYGYWRIANVSFREGPVIALVQGNLSQVLRNNPTTGKSICDHYVALCDLAARERPALIVTPETSMLYRWEEEWPGGLISETKVLCRNIGQRFHTDTLLGINTRNLGPDEILRRYNSAVLVNRRGQALARYDKIHRVPFGEYVPLRDLLPFMNWFSPYNFDYSITPGAGATRFPLQGDNPNDPLLHYGVVICYESGDSDRARPYAGGDGHERTDFLLNISNDGWFDGTTEFEQHLAVCRFCAIECRQPLARAVNMGISALIDSNGAVLAPRQLRSESVPSGIEDETTAAAIWTVGPGSGPLPIERWKEYKSNAGVLLATLPLDSRSSLYARFGDWLPWTCSCIVGLALVTALVRPAAARAATDAVS